MTPPLVTVVVPVFNGQAFLDAAITSALSQSYEPLEVIVVDDGSTDESSRIAAQRGVAVLHQPHRGVSAALNAGVAAAGGEMIAFLDADDLWPSDRLAIQVPELLRRPELGFVMAHAIQFVESGEKLPPWLTDQWLASVRSPGKPPPPPSGRGVTAPVPLPRTMLARTQVFERTGGFDENLDLGEDLDWLMRATDAGIAHALLPDVVLRHRLHSSNTSHRLADSLAGRLRIARQSAQRKRRRNEPSISVVIPVLNGERFLREAIVSAFAQTYPPVEVIVVDDGSSDRSAAIAEELGALVLRRGHRGVSAARNAGVAAAQGDLIALLDADDRWPLGRLAVQVERLRRRPELGFLIGRARIFLEPGVTRPQWLTDDLANDGSSLAMGTILARRDLFEQVGGFDESLDICEDLDWLARAHDANIPYEVLDDVVLEYRFHGANTGLPRRGDLEQGVLRTIRSSLQRKRAQATAR